MGSLHKPQYPALALPLAIEYAREVHERCGQESVHRRVAAQHMGFSGLSGTSDRVLSSLFQYGLIEKSTAGEIRISDLALDILDAHNETARRAWLQVAAFKPALFKELREDYLAGLPTASILQAHLLGKGLGNSAVLPLAKAYLETCQFLQEQGVYESAQPSGRNEPRSSSALPKQHPLRTQQQPLTIPSD